MLDNATCEDDDFVMVQKIEKGQFLDEIAKNIDAFSAELREVSLEIHDHPELQYKEFHAHKVLT